MEHGNWACFDSRTLGFALAPKMFVEFPQYLDHRFDGDDCHNGYWGLFRFASQVCLEMALVCFVCECSGVAFSACGLSSRH